MVEEAPKQKRSNLEFSVRMAFDGTTCVTDIPPKTPSRPKAAALKMTCMHPKKRTSESERRGHFGVDKDKDRGKKDKKDKDTKTKTTKAETNPNPNTNTKTKTK
jgi:hypothetical protein